MKYFIFIKIKNLNFFYFLKSAKKIDHANYTGKSSDIYAANHFSKTQINDLKFEYSNDAATEEHDLVYANYHKE